MDPDEGKAQKLFLTSFFRIFLFFNFKRIRRILGVFDFYLKPTKQIKERKFTSGKQ